MTLAEVVADQLVVAGAGVHGVAAGAEGEEGVGAVAAVQRVGARLAAEEEVVAGAAVEDVVAGAAVEDGRQRRGKAAGELQVIVALITPEGDEAERGAGRRTARP